MTTINPSSDKGQCAIIPLHEIVNSAKAITTLLNEGNFEIAHTNMEDLWRAHPHLKGSAALRRVEERHHSALVAYVNDLILHNITKKARIGEDGKFYVPPQNAQEVEDAVDFMAYHTQFLREGNTKMSVRRVLDLIVYEKD